MVASFCFAYAANSSSRRGPPLGSGHQIGDPRVIAPSLRSFSAAASRASSEISSARRALVSVGSRSRILSLTALILSIACCTMY